ncbi:Dbl homology domain-containing protein, partial [Mycena crocata]
SQSDSLYLRCSSLRTRLMHLRGFAYYFSLIPNRERSDPVTELWDVFSLGVSLCYIFDELPNEYCSISTKCSLGYGLPKIDRSTFNATYAANPMREQNHAAVLFAMQIRQKEFIQRLPGCESFTLTDLVDRSSPAGLEKVLKCVNTILVHLSSSSFESQIPAANPSPAVEAATSAVRRIRAERSAVQRRNNIVREIVQTERQYVQKLNDMQTYATALSQSNLVDKDTIDLLFPNIAKILDLHRKLLGRFDDDAELEWHEQRWGQHFSQAEEEFSVHELCGASYEAAGDWLHENEQTLTPLNYLMDVRSELPICFVRTVSRACKYPLLLDCLARSSSAATNPHHAELQLGLAAAKRVTDRLNAGTLRSDRARTLTALHARLVDWKGLQPDTFGTLLLDDIFTVHRAGVEREYHVFLFERILLCCKERPEDADGTQLKRKNNSILPSHTNRPRNKRKTPLVLKGRVLTAHITRVVHELDSGGGPRTYPLTISWRGDGDVSGRNSDIEEESFILHCRGEEHMRQWETQLNKLSRHADPRKVN